MIFFSDFESDYQIHDYLPKDGQLLLRSVRNPERDFNIDIQFIGMNALMLPKQVIGLELSLFSPNDSDDSWMENFGFVMNGDLRVFALNDSAGNVFFVNAESFNVYHCPLDSETTSLGRYEKNAFETEKVFSFED